MPLAWFPQILLDLGSFEVNLLNDRLMGQSRTMPWFQSLVACELVFQLPFFFYALHTILRTTTHPPGVKQRNVATVPSSSYPESFRRACIAYGAHTATTLAPILTFFWTVDSVTTLQRSILTAVYFPYLAIPLALMYYAMTADSGVVVDGSSRLSDTTKSKRP